MVNELPNSTLCKTMQHFKPVTIPGHALEVGDLMKYKSTKGWIYLVSLKTSSLPTQEPDSIQLIRIYGDPYLTPVFKRKESTDIINKFSKKGRDWYRVVDLLGKNYPIPEKSMVEEIPRKGKKVKAQSL